MTIIAWDGKTLAADQNSWSGGACSKVRKIFRIDMPSSVGIHPFTCEALVALVGYEYYALGMLKWLTGKTGEKPLVYEKHYEDDVGLIIIPPQFVYASTLVYKLHATGTASLQAREYEAMGSYRVATLSLLAAGIDAKRTVELVLQHSDMGHSEVDILRI